MNVSPTLKRLFGLAAVVLCIIGLGMLAEHFGVYIGIKGVKQPILANTLSDEEFAEQWIEYVHTQTTYSVTPTPPPSIPNERFMRASVPEPAGYLEKTYVYNEPIEFSTPGKYMSVLISESKNAFIFGHEVTENDESFVVLPDKTAYIVWRFDIESDQAANEQAVLRYVQESMPWAHIMISR